jgi:hypothetical protein
LTGFENITIVMKVAPKFLAKNMARILVVAHKPENLVSQ